MCDYACSVRFAQIIITKEVGMKKKILMLSSSWNNDLTHELIKGICERLGQDDVELHIMNIYDVLEPAGFYQKELEVFLLPNPSKYDGVLVAVNSVASISVVDEILEKVRKANAKVLCIDRRHNGLPNISSDNYGAEYKIVDHLIQVHGCKKLNFVGGPVNNEENQLRYRAFCDALKANGIEPEPERIRFYGFLQRDGKLAYRDFKKLGLHLPDAVVCANDFMALGYCNEAETDGYQAPEDFKITGFDNLFDAQFYFPSITTVDRDYFLQGYDAANTLMEMIDGKHEGKLDFYSGTTVRLNESCGCKVLRDFRKEFTNVYVSKTEDEYIRSVQRLISRYLTKYNTAEKLPEALEECKRHLKLYDICLCINPSAMEMYGEDVFTGFDEVLDMYTSTGVGKIRIADQLYPPEWADLYESKIYMFSPLHFGDITFGYCVIPYEESSWNLLDFRTYSEALSQAMDNMHQRHEVDLVNKKLRALYTQDAMTGLYNRFGYATFAEEFYAKHKGKVYLIYVDLDDLKILNDTYGHSVGDIAINGIAEAIKKVIPEDSVKVRMGGDEFLVIAEYISEAEILTKEDQIKSYLAEYSKREALPVEIVASMGHVWNEGDASAKSLESLVNEADNNMYKIKQSKKHRRSTD